MALTEVQRHIEKHARTGNWQRNCRFCQLSQVDRISADRTAADEAGQEARGEHVVTVTLNRQTGKFAAECHTCTWKDEERPWESHSVQQKIQHQNAARAGLL